MADVFTEEKRSQIMRLVKGSRNKSTELRLISFFKKNKITGWRRNYRLFGKPDFVFPKHRVAIFVDGCFWHGHTCRNTKPKTNSEYWKSKIERNKKRDRNVAKVLLTKRWIVVRIWECFLKDQKRLTKKMLFYSKPL